MDNGAAGKIKTREFAARCIEQPALSPHHVRHRIVDKERPEHGEEHHCAELHALCEGTGDQRRRDDGEHHLVDHVGLGRKGRVCEIGLGANADQKGVMQAADEAGARIESQAVAQQGPGDADDGHHGEALHHGAQHVFLAYEAAVEQRQARPGHHEDQRGADQHPGVIGGIFGVRYGLLQGGNVRRGGCSSRLCMRQDGQQHDPDCQNTILDERTHPAPFEQRLILDSRLHGEFGGGPYGP